MKLVIFGLTLSSSWGNGHATLWRGLLRALHQAGHEIVFFEHDVPFYADNRDLFSPDWCNLRLYRNWHEQLPSIRRHLSEADVAMVTSYCPDALQANAAIADAAVPLNVFYDLDTPVTLERLHRGEPVNYLGPRGLADYDLVLSYTGGRVLDALQTELGARRVAPLYGFVDPRAHFPVPPDAALRNDLSYLGTFAEDRQATLEALFIEPARRLPTRRFLLGGAQYPADFPWTDNVFFLRHVPPPQHPAFFSSSRLTLNVTRRAMRESGLCPSGRLFEAAACGTPLLSDAWEGLDQFFTPGAEILVAHTTADAVAALDLTDAELRRIAHAARERTLAEHTAAQRAEQLEQLLTDALSPPAAPTRAASPGHNTSTAATIEET